MHTLGNFGSLSLGFEAERTPSFAAWLEVMPVVPRCSDGLHCTWPVECSPVMVLSAHTLGGTQGGLEAAIKALVIVTSPLPFPPEFSLSQGPVHIVCVLRIGVHLYCMLIVCQVPCFVFYIINSFHLHECPVGEV